MKVVSSYIDIFLSTHLYFLDECKVASKVSFFLCLWKLWLHLGTHTYSLRKNLISHQAYLDMDILCHYIVLPIKLLKDKYNHLKIPFGLLGSDVCKKKIQFSRWYDFKREEPMMGLILWKVQEH